MILVVADHSSGKLNKVTSELISAARTVANGLPIGILVLGSNIGPLADESVNLASEVFVADLPELAHYDPQVWSAAVAQVARDRNAEFVVIAANRAGREYSPRTAVKLKAVLFEDIFALERGDASTSALRYTYLARVTEKIVSEVPTVVATIKPGAFPSASPLPARGNISAVTLTLSASRMRVTGSVAESNTRVALEDAKIIVSGGRGVGDAAGFQRYVEGLADQLGAAVGATRAVVDAGWRPYSEQVGQTGKTVQPKAYIALGISGAVQHLSGMNKSGFIVAINKDPDCPMIRNCDLGIVGNVAEIVPSIIVALRA